MLRAVFPPACLLLALALAIVGFSMLAFGAPEDTVSLHAARAAGDELSTEVLEADLEQRQTSRVMTIVLIFCGSGVMTLVAFGSMGGSSSNPK